MNLGAVIHLNKTALCLILGVALILFIYTLSGNGKNSDVMSTLKINLKNLLAVAIKAAENGGKEIDKSKSDLNVKSKGLTKEGLPEPVTIADSLSHCAILKTLKHAYPSLNVISEEAKTKCKSDQVVDLKIDGFPEDLKDEWVNVNDVTVWIDPLDATYEYTAKLYDYVTTMVCVAVKGKPVIGVIHKPFSKDEFHTFWAWSNKSKSSNLMFKKSNRDKLKVIVSMSHAGKIKELLESKLSNYEIISAAGSGYKSLEVAVGNVDVYIHITNIKKWDICAGNAIVNAMGGKMTTKSGQEIDYTAHGSVKNEDGVIAAIQNHNSIVERLE